MLDKNDLQMIQEMMLASEQRLFGKIEESEQRMTGKIEESENRMKVMNPISIPSSTCCTKTSRS